MLLPNNFRLNVVVVVVVVAVVIVVQHVDCCLRITFIFMLLLLLLTLTKNVPQDLKCKISHVFKQRVLPKVLGVFSSIILLI